MVRRISLGMTTRPRSSIRRTIPVAFKRITSNFQDRTPGVRFAMLPRTCGLGGMTCRQMVLSANFSSLCRRRTGYVWKLFEKKIFGKIWIFWTKELENLVKLQNKLGKTTKVPRAFSTGLFLTVFFTRSIIKLSYIHEQNTKDNPEGFQAPRCVPQWERTGEKELLIHGREGTSPARFHAGTLSRRMEVVRRASGGKAREDRLGISAWAPHAKSVSVVGDFNDWKRSAARLRKNGEVWEGFVPDLKEYTSYKYAVEGADGTVHFKADPYASTRRPGPPPPASCMIFPASAGVMRSSGTSRPNTRCTTLPSTSMRSI